MHTVKAVSLAGILFVGTYSLSLIHAGNPPTERHSVPFNSSPTNQALEQLRKATADAPNDLPAWKSLATALGEELKNDDFQSQELTLELVDVLSNVLRLEPSDGQALLTLANLAFNQKAFDKSAELYERYLSVNPSDLLARASYGSSLSFLGKLDQAEQELKATLKLDSAQFQALAYLCILYSQKGDQKSALEYGNKAIKAAPSDEARTRLSAFLTKLRVGSESSVHAAGKIESPGSLDEYVKKHPILGQRLVEIERSTAEIRIKLKEFPLAAMPPMAKNKLSKDLLPLVSPGQKVILVDIDNNQELTINN